MALFGRDSIITSYQMLPFIPELSATTLRVLAAKQGKYWMISAKKNQDVFSTSFVSAN